MLLQLNRLVTEKWVDGWDDPRMMTLAGLRRRGVTSTSIYDFVRGIGITRRLEYILFSVQASTYLTSHFTTILCRKSSRCHLYLF